MKKSAGIVSTESGGGETPNGESLRVESIAMYASQNPTQDDEGFDGEPQPDLNSPEELEKTHQEFETNYFN